MAQVFQLLVQQRIDEPSVLLQDFRPRQLGETIGDPLRLFRVIELHEGVVDLLEANAALRHFLHDVIMAVDIDLAGERRPRLQAHMHQAEVFVPEIVIKDALRNLFGNETRPIFAGRQLESGASLHDAQHADQPVVQRMLVQLLFGPGILVDLALMVFVEPTELGGESLGMVDDLFGPGGRDDLHEISTPHLQHIIDELFKCGGVAEGQMPLEDDPVKTRKVPGDQAGKLDDERAYCLHGIRFLNDCW